jgi:phosphoribosylanthranilate isomerase
MIIKVCGITNAEDAEAALSGGANAIGFNFYPRSPRYIAPDRAAEIPTPGARRVGVFVNESPAHIAEVARLAALDTAQLHGDESAADYPEQLAVWKAARVGSGFTFEPYADVPVEALLLDGPAGDLYGGAGRAFDWQVAAATRHRIIVAGGLDASNVARAVELAHPWGVDACSRIESAPGKKDHAQMKRFLLAARAALRS